MNKNELGKRIPLEGTINTRDLGGYQTKDGRIIQFKRIVRTDCLSHVTEKDIDYIHNVLNAKIEIDMRGFRELREEPNKEMPFLTFYHLPIQEELEKGLDMNPHTHFEIEDKGIKGTVEYLFRMDKNGDITTSFEKNYRNMLKPFGQKQYAKFLHICQKNKTGCILFHCADGKDRSGLAAAILLIALGVDEETVLADYLKTNENTKKKAEKREDYLRNVCHIQDETVIQSIKTIAGVRRNWMEAAFDEMKKQAGSIDSFLENNLNLSKEDRKELQENYLN